MRNDLGIDPYEWFEDSFDQKVEVDVESIRPIRVEDFPPELMEVPTSIVNPKPKVEPKKEETIHEKMYKVATKNHNPLHVGGSENVKY
tara:strand:+ start:487 stop:750 length:264 start_codon:yes stop_codon:yes gene_type:complete